MQEYRGLKVLVTGADGFIGSHLTERLAAAGAMVTTLACYNSFDFTAGLTRCLSRHVPRSQCGAGMCAMPISCVRSCAAKTSYSIWQP